MSGLLKYADSLKVKVESISLGQGQGPKVGFLLSKMLVQLHDAMLCYAMLCYAMLCYATLCYAVFLATFDHANMRILYEFWEEQS